MKKIDVERVGRFREGVGPQMEGASRHIILAHDPPSEGTLDALRRRRRLERLERLERLSGALALLVCVYLTVRSVA